MNRRGCLIREHARNAEARSGCVDRRLCGRQSSVSRTATFRKPRLVGNDQRSGEASTMNVMQSCMARSGLSGEFRARSGSPDSAQVMRRTDPTRVAIEDESGSAPIRIATSMPSSIMSRFRSARLSRMSTCRWTLENSATTGSTCSRPNTIGAVIVSAPDSPAVLAGHAAVGVFDVGENTLARIEVAPPRVGERHPPRRPRDEPRAHMFLERCDIAADGRHGHA